MKFVKLVKIDIYKGLNKKATHGSGWLLAEKQS